MLKPQRASRGAEARTPRRRRWLRILVVVAALVPFALGGAQVLGHGDGWQTASREPVGLAPDPATTREAVVQVYAARAWGWRGTFGVHTWIAVKPTDAPAFTVYEVIGWHALRGQPVLRTSRRAPDARWFGNAPELVADVRGDGVDAIIARIGDAVAAYPYATSYTIWPGPNSNTFTAAIARAVPELGLDLPPTAIGKDYIAGGGFLARAPSGTGWQISLFGLLGLMVASEEGIELNLLGLTFGIDLDEPAIKLPLLGRIELGRA